MTDPPDSEQIRELGIDFGPLAQHLAQHDYPTTSSALVEAYGDTVLKMQNGEQTLREVFELVPDVQFESVTEAREAIIASVDERAIGRKGYSDRTPPAPGEEREESTESF